MNNPGMIVVESSKEKNEKLRKKWTEIYKTSSEVTKLAGTGFVGSILSPFDFEGPVVEIATAVIAGVAFVTKKVAEYKLDKFADEATKIIDADDKNALATIANNMGGVVASRKR